MQVLVEDMICMSKRVVTTGICMGKDILESDICMRLAIKTVDYNSGVPLGDVTPIYRADTTLISADTEEFTADYYK